MSNRTVNATDQQGTALACVVVGGVTVNLGKQATPTVTDWIDTRGWSWTDWVVVMDNAVNTTNLVAVFEQYSGGLTDPGGSHPATSSGVREVGYETWDSGTSTFVQAQYTAASPTKVAGQYASEGWTFTTPTHGRFMRMIVYGTGISAVSSADTVAVKAFRRS